MPEYEAWETLMTEYNYGSASREFTNMLATNGVKTWAYRWDFFDESFPVHTSEIRYLFKMPSSENPFGYLPQHKNMAKIMNDCWHAFIATGNPQTTDLPEWIPYTSSDNGNRMYFSEYSSAESFDLNEYDHDFNLQEIILSE
jgi:para-nitrobenzyl esterase